MTLRVGWLQTYDPIKGGAEITADLLKQARPEGVEIVDCPAGGVVDGLDAYAVLNYIGYSLADVQALPPAKVVRYAQDADPHGDPATREWLVTNAAKLLLLSPLHLATVAWAGDRDVEFVPPPIDADAFSSNGQPRQGTVWIGTWTWGGKGIEVAAQWGSEHGGITFYGEGPLVPPKLPGVTIKPPVPYADVPALLARSERLVHLPTKPEPFARTVAEGYLAGCEVVTNENAGAVWWIRERPEDLTRGAEMFWAQVEAVAS